jgi:hypothetical protein
MHKLMIKYLKFERMWMRYEWQGRGAAHEHSCGGIINLRLYDLGSHVIKAFAAQLRLLDPNLFAIGDYVQHQSSEEIYFKITSITLPLECEANADLIDEQISYKDIQNPLYTLSVSNSEHKMEMHDVPFGEIINLNKQMTRTELQIICDLGKQSEATIIEWIDNNISSWNHLHPNDRGVAPVGEPLTETPADHDVDQWTAFYASVSNLVQKHRCSNYCQKKARTTNKIECRGRFPRPITDETTLIVIRRPDGTFKVGFCLFVHTYISLVCLFLI